VSGATLYNLKRSTTSGAYYVNIATLTGTSFTNTGLINGTTYYYIVTAVGSGGPSTNSAQLAAAPFGPPPAPTGLTAGPDSYVGVSLSWNASSAATNYNVKRATISGGPYTTIATRANLDYNDTNVVSGTTYYYVVSALSAGGESANSLQASATPSNAGDVVNGLAANWRFDENLGTTAFDSSGNNNTGTLVNSPTWVAPGRIGASDLSFLAASQQSVTATNSGSLNPSAGITIAAWINATDWSGNRRIVQKGNSDNQYRLLAENGAFKWHLNGVGTLTGALPQTNVWVHVAGTWNGSVMTIYTNGVLEASLAAAGGITTTADLLAIGKKNGSTTSGDYFYGQMDEVRIYNRGLGAVEINTVMHAGDTPPTTPTGLAAAPGNAQINLSWTLTSGASSYNVKRSTINGGPYTTVGTSFSSRYTDAGLTNGTTYYYVVSAVNFTNESPDSAQVSATPGIGVTFYVDANYSGAATRILTAGNYTLSQLAGAGSPNDSASSCRIPNGWTVIIYQNDGFSGTSWTLTSDTPNFTAYAGLNDNMSSCRIMAGALPGVPTGLSATGGAGQARLSWNTSSGAATYNLKRSTTSGGPYTPVAGTTGTTFTNVGLANGTTYYYVVSAANANGESANSAQVSVTPVVTPILLSLGPQTDGQFSFSYPGDQSWIIETSTNLNDWAPVFTNAPTNGPVVFTETNAADPARFYRARQ
jgi:fibronectin type 3 domain-containing protein